MKTIKQEIADLHKIEQQAQKLTMRMDKLREKWTRQLEFLKTTAPIAWKDHCEAEGWAENYRFEDILC